MKNQTIDLYSTLKEKILNGYYKPAESLTEMYLATHYKVSRNTVKKALLMLQQDNLLSIERNKSAKVRSYSLEEIIDFMELRWVLEGLLLRKAAEVITDEQISCLEQILGTMKEYIAKKDLLSYSQNNQKFHTYIYTISPNKAAVAVALQLKTQMTKYNSKTILIPGRDVESFNEHACIVEALRQHDGKKAEEAVRVHMENVLSVFKKNYSLLF